MFLEIFYGLEMKRIFSEEYVATDHLVSHGKNKYSYLQFGLGSIESASKGCTLILINLECQFGLRSLFGQC